MYEWSQNIAALPIEAIGFIATIFTGNVPGYEAAYMVELKIDDPLQHIQNGDNSFIIHTGAAGYKSNAKYLLDRDWAVIHRDDMIWRTGQINVMAAINSAKIYLEGVEREKFKKRSNYVLPKKSVVL